MAKIKRILLTFALIAAVFCVAGFFCLNHLKNQANKTAAQLLSKQAAAKKAVDYINNNMLQKGTTASLVEVKEESGLYKFILKIKDKEFTSYVTKDGKILFPEEGVDLTKEPSASANNAPTKKLTCKDIKKSDNPTLEAFVVSRCPFGLQMQRILRKVVKDIPSLAKNIRVEYIGSVQGGKISSMHGDQEAKENLRQICIREEQSDKYWDYIDCYIKKGQGDKCLAEAGVDEEKLTSCANDSARGLKYAKDDFASANKYKVRGSPTLVLEGQNVSEFDFGGRTAEAVKTLLCCAFETKPAVCSKKLSQDQAAVGLSEKYSGSGGSASCKE